MGEERCVCCGAPIPEGIQVCRDCQLKSLDYGFYIGYAEIEKLRYPASGTMKEMIQWAEEQLVKGAETIQMWKKEETDSLQD